MTDTTILSINLISTNPMIRDGRPCIAGTGITVADVMIQTVFHRLTPDQIDDDLALSLAQVYAALSYYYDHKAEIDTSIDDRRKIAEAAREQRLGSRHPPLFG